MFISVGLLTTLSELKHQWKISAHVRVRPHPSPTPPPPNKCRQQGSCPVTIVLSKSNLFKVGNMSCMKLNLVIFKTVWVDIDTLYVVNFINKKKAQIKRENIDG